MYGYKTSSPLPRRDLSMPGHRITDQQVRLYMDSRRKHTQRLAAAKAGLSERTGRRFESDPRRPSQKKLDPPTASSRPDPLASVWESEILPLLGTTAGLRPITILEEIERRHPETDWRPCRRTLERRIQTWKALHGGEQEVIFHQVQRPGQRALSDFTDAADLAITIAGQPIASTISRSPTPAGSMPRSCSVARASPPWP